jgi:hypothetical protein
MVFVSFRIFFSDNTRVRILFFFPEFDIRFYNRNSESDYCFFLQQNQNIFLEINHTPPFKLNGRPLLIASLLFSLLKR